MKFLTTKQMRETDRRCIEDIGIPGAVLMNNAGSAVFREIRKGPVGVVCGKGNNGGDGFVVARLALLAGYEPEVILVARPEALDPATDAGLFLNAYRNLGGKLTCATDPAEVAEKVRGLDRCAVLVDALLGTGIQGEVRGEFRAAIEAWPKNRTIAVDLPSGLNADTGEPSGCCVRADVTVTFQFPKTGFENPAAREFVGRLVVADIGIPEACADDAAWKRLREPAQNTNPRDPKREVLGRP